VKILIFLYFLDNDNLAVGRGNDNLFGVVAVEIAYRGAIEVEHDKIYRAEYCGECPERNFRVE
jgi:hypothetical protein